MRIGKLLYINPKHYTWIIGVLLVFLWLYQLLFGDFGYIQYRRLKKKHTIIEKQVIRKLIEQQALVRKRDLLKTNSYIERIAREECAFGKAGERVYVFVQDTSKISGNK